MSEEQTSNNLLDEKQYPTTPDNEGYYFVSLEDENNGVKKRIYPSPESDDGFFVETESDDELKIFTKVYPNGNKVKKIFLPLMKKTVLVRELIAKDTKEIFRFMDKDQEKYTMAAITVGSTVDDSKQPFEFYEKMKMKDYNLIVIMFSDLNF